jgi:hypothetical protein
MKKTILIMTMALIVAMLSMIGCKDGGDTNGPTGVVKSITLNKTSLALDLDIVTTGTLTATITNGAAGDTIDWSSSDTNEDFITISESDDGLSCTVTAVAETTGPVTITASLTSDPTVKKTCQVTVTAEPVVPSELTLKFSNSVTESSGAKHASASEDPTTALPEPAENIYTVHSGYNTGNWGSTGRFTDTTFIYVDKLITGNFKFRARVQVGAFPAGTSNSRGMMVGAFKPNDDGNLAQDSSVAALFLRGNSAIRGAFPRAGDTASVGGIDLSVNRLNEFIYEFQRTDTGFKSTVFVSKTGTDELATNSTSGFANGANNYEIQADTPVYAGVALMCVEDVRISKLELWIDDLEGSPVFYSGNSTPAEVKVDTVRLGVQGGTVSTSGANPGSAANPAKYIVKASTVTTSGIQLVPSFIPTYADNLNVMYFKEDGGSATLNIDANTGKVTVTGTGSATFRVQSYSNEGAEYYLTIDAIPDYIAIEAFNITGGDEPVMVGMTAELTTDISADILAASDPQIVWTASSTDVKFVVAGEEEDTATGHSVRIKGINMNASVTITATATTQDGTNTPDVQTATKVIVVGAFNASIWTWKPGDSGTNTANSIYAQNTAVGGVGTPGMPIIQRGSGTRLQGDADGNLKMLSGGARFQVGTTDTAEYNDNLKAALGTIDLSNNFKITITLKDVSGTGSFWIYLANTQGGSSQGAFIVPTTALTTSATGDGKGTVTGGSADCTLIQDAHTSTAWSGEITYTVKVDVSKIQLRPAFITSADKGTGTYPSATSEDYADLLDYMLKNAYLQIRLDNGSTNIATITSIKIEYDED